MRATMTHLWHGRNRLKTNLRFTAQGPNNAAAHQQVIRLVTSVVDVIETRGLDKTAANTTKNNHLQRMNEPSLGTHDRLPSKSIAIGIDACCLLDGFHIVELSQPIDLIRLKFCVFLLLVQFLAGRNSSLVATLLSLGQIVQQRIAEVMIIRLCKTLHFIDQWARANFSRLGTASDLDRLQYFGFERVFVGHGCYCCFHVPLLFVRVGIVVAGCCWRIVFLQVLI